MNCFLEWTKSIVSDIACMYLSMVNECLGNVWLDGMQFLCARIGEINSTASNLVINVIDSFCMRDGLKLKPGLPQFLERAIPS